ncbi:hypothetical protein [Cupriavidus plantarum]|uniref:hypothetical protein n=1 Tax=Cupriavidus plantarum TaxID=942865 RepID=UPI000EAB7C81|nr:hypothetical protein [Cupriavidus plantarum]NYI01379.1 choline dehydrogenase-like flavoprotein [Cupriavidus plantarum]RLK33369.1 hypothetical protein C7417_4016 [Cupriavidus plantarum]
MKQTHFLSAAAAITLAMALGSPGAHAHEIYAGIGTEGVGAGFAYALDDRFNARAEINGFALSRSFTAGDLSYDARATLLHGGLYADWFPAPQTAPFRFVIGALIGDDHVNATATSTNGTYNINGVVVAANGETVTARARYPTVRPYLGIGFGHTPNGKPGFGMYFDAGVTYGRPRVSLNVPDSIAAQVGQANIDAERQELQDKANRLRFYPIVKIGVTYRF